MSKAGWLPPISLLAMGVLILLVSFLRPIVPFSVTGQAFLVFILVRAFCYGAPFRRWAGAMPWPHRLVLILLVGGLIAGPFTLSTHRYFPFVAWEIFGFEREDNPVSCREFLATTASGKQVRLLVEQIFPSIVQFNPPDDNDSAAMSDLVAAMARVYNRHHASDPVQQVDLVRRAVALHPKTDPPPPPCVLLKRFAISSDRSN